MPKISNIGHKEFGRFLEYIGCVLVRSVGDHFMYTRPGLLRPIVLPRYNPLPEFIIRNNLRILGLTTKEFLLKLDEMGR